MFEMPMWVALVTIATAGAIGGFGNALISDNGFFFPKTDQVGGGGIRAIASYFLEKPVRIWGSSD